MSSVIQTIGGLPVRACLADADTARRRRLRRLHEAAWRLEDRQRLLSRPLPLPRSTYGRRQVPSPLARKRSGRTLHRDVVEACILIGTLAGLVLMRR